MSENQAELSHKLNKMIQKFKIENKNIKKIIMKKFTKVY